MEIKMPPGWKIVDSILTFTTDQILEEDYDYKGSRDIIYGAEEFDNFELYVEWNIPKGGNSGIFYHLKEGYDGPPVVAPEYQLLDDENYAEIHNYELKRLATYCFRLCHACSRYHSKKYSTLPASGTVVGLFLLR
jgi:hypothetical protein